LKKLFLILSSIIILNGAFSLICLGFQSELSPDGQIQELRQSIKTILKQPQFQYHDPFEWLKGIFKQLARWFKPLSKSQPAKFENKTLDLVLKWAGIFILVTLPVILVFLGNRFLLPNLTLKERSAPLSGMKPIDSSTLKRMSVSFEETGNYREAIRYLYLAGLEKLKEENILPQSVKFSDKENIRTLKKVLGASNTGYLAFSGLVKIFQEKWYGLKICQSEDYLQSKIFLDTLWVNTGQPND
jgi:hypothetical protein